VILDTDLQPFCDSTELRDDAAGLRHRAASDGYLWLRGAVPTSKVAALRARVLESCARLGWLAPAGDTDAPLARPGLRLGGHDDPRYHAFLAEILASPEFMAIGDDEVVTRVVAAQCNAPMARRNADICRVFSPDSDEFTTLPHQDHYYLGGSPQGWTAWVPLGDCPIELGPLAVLPGSHRAGALPHVGSGTVKHVVDMPDDVRWASGDLASGDIVLFHAFTLHGALPNRSGSRLRLSADYRYLPAG
jgi:ectoine hydroxylase-related dioxygenase (phytanoyl-CoA dioxygenase family)